MNYMQIDFGAINIENLLVIQKTFTTCINTYEKSLNSKKYNSDADCDKSNNIDKNSDNLMEIITPKCSYRKSKTSEEFYQDDLRYFLKLLTIVFYLFFKFYLQSWCISVYRNKF